MSKWDILTERRLFITIMEVTSPKPPPWGLVSEKMGPDFTAESCRQYFARVKRSLKNEDDSSKTEGDTIGPPSTPTKGRGPKTPSSSNRKRKEANRDDDESFTPTPSSEKKKKRSAAEDQDDIVLKIDEDEEGKSLLPDAVDDFFGVASKA